LAGKQKRTINVPHLLSFIAMKNPVFAPGFFVAEFFFVEQPGNKNHALAQ